MRRIRPILIIMVGLLIWGGIHSYGAYLMNHNPLRGLVISAFTCGFLAFWGFLIYWKWDYLNRRGGASSISPPTAVDLAVKQPER